MVRFTGGLLLFSAFQLALAAPKGQTGLFAADQKLVVPERKKEAGNPRKLQGRFLHITDLHPDPFYKIGSDDSEACHSGSGYAGKYGAEVSDCDSPFSLINATFKWIKEHLRDKVDFVVWTGDSARHDNDENHPRTEEEVLGLNKYIVDKFIDVFGKHDNTDEPDPTHDFIIPIVPTFGNNDVLPHNILQPGPNKWTRRYAGVWEKFVPQEQIHSFARGGWFFTEVIPKKLAVISLNTMYFFDNNAAVDGCDAKSEPGYEHMQWLRIQLQFLRERGMKAILMGHVPPARTENKQSWDETCWQKYSLWVKQYRDVIVGSVYGHMNIDHFMLQDFREIKYKIKGEVGTTPQTDLYRRPVSDDTFSTAGLDAYLNDLRKLWQSLPEPPQGLSYSNFEYPDDDLSQTKKKKKSKKQKKKEKFLKDIGGQWAERFSLALGAPSVVPNYYPTLRVIEYNITGIENEHPARGPVDGSSNPGRIDVPAVETSKLRAGAGVSTDHCNDVTEQLKKKKSKKPSFTVPKPPPKSAPPGPAYSPQTFTFTSYIQYFANITRMNSMESSTETDFSKHRPASKPFKYEIEYHSRKDSHYQLQDLTLRSLLNLAEKIGRVELANSTCIEANKGMSNRMEEGCGSVSSEDDRRDWLSVKMMYQPKNSLWRAFVRRAFVDARPEKQLEDNFG